MKNLFTLLIGFLGIGSTEVISQLETPASAVVSASVEPTGTTLELIIKIVVQLVIGVATVLQLIKKKTPESIKS